MRAAWIIVLAASAWGLGISKGLAQTNPTLPIVNCATMEQDSINRLLNPQRGTLEEFEYALQQKVTEIQGRLSSRTEAEILTIPIIVHVVHNGESVGTGMNLSQAQVMAQIEVLNEDFRRKDGTPGFNTNPVGADIEIEFCLSSVDENGNLLSQPGIHRYRGGKTSWTRAEIDGTLKPSTIWNPNMFYNIWTLNFGGADSNLLGYAQFPDQSGLQGINPTGGPATTDGVVVQYTSFGSVDKGNFPIMQAPYNKGRTLTHETGHFLGLRHIWGDGPCANDFVDDTPTSHAENRGCPIGKISCDGTSTEMVQNYMDYTDDACMNIFTKGQKTRILAVMELSPRRKTLSESNLCSTVVADAPDANFTVDKLACVLLGSEITFTDLSSNFPTSWSWTFEGGDPTTSTLRNPRIKYNSPGTFNVTLVVENAIGQDALTIEDYIVVSEEGVCSSFSNFDAAYTPSVLDKSSFGDFTGFLTGHNSDKNTAYSELFTNSCGYKYISGVNIDFGAIDISDETAKVTVTVWNARGLQGGPGAVIERKEVSIKQLQTDVASGFVSTIIFDRETPVFSRAFHVGIEIEYDEGYSLAVTSSANGEATNSTSWVRLASGEWKQMAIAFGANIAMNINPIVGVKPSVQISTSKPFITPGEEVILNAKGASIFVWDSQDGNIQDYLGPQLIVRPTETTTYMVEGSGLELCNSIATTTIYVGNLVTEVTEDLTEEIINLYPNPGTDILHINVQNTFIGEIQVEMLNLFGQSLVPPKGYFKNKSSIAIDLETSRLPGGTYLVRIKAGNAVRVQKWLKL